MYSLVLLAAMSTGTEAAAFGGGWYNKCTLDMCCPMRYGWVSCGCHGYWHGCGGCYGGCWGGCYGGCYGGCSGYGWPLSYGVYPPLLPYGGYGLYPVTPPTTLPTDPRTATTPTLGPAPVEPLPQPKELPKRPLTSYSPNAAVASIQVEVPADARVYIDGNQMKSSSTRRLFTTPPLEPGQDYYYWVRVTVEDGGKTVEEVRKVIVRAGDRAESSFAGLVRERPALADAGKTRSR